MRDFFRKRVEKSVENRVKRAVDREMGGNEENDERSSEEEHQNEGRGRKLFRRLSDKFRLRSASSNTSPDVKRKPKLKSKTANDATLVSNDQKAKTTSGNTSAAGTDSDFARTETPVNSANLDSDPENVSPASNQSRAGSDWQSGSTASDQSDVEERKRKQRSAAKKDDLRLLEMRPDDAVAYNPQTKTNFKVRVRIIEAKELQGDDLSPLVRVHLGGKTRTTRSIRSTSNPRWDHTTDFSMRTSMENLAMLNCEFNVYSARRLIRDSLIGTFCMNVGVVYKSKQQAVVEKWLALMPGRQEEDGVGLNTGSEICGFLKVSICVYHEKQVPPSLISRGGDAQKEDVVYSAQLLNYCLKFRIFKVSQLADYILHPYKQTPMAPGELALEICVGPKRAMTSFMKGDDETLYFREEVQIPIMWPTVIKEIRFRLIARNVRGRKRVLCTESLSLRQLCQAGERGYLPTFGPSFVSFYGPTNKNTLWRSWDLSQIREGKQKGTHYCGRVHFEILCEESIGADKTHVIDIPTSMIQASELFHRQEHFTLFCTFFSANLIHSDFKSKDVQFVVSVGEFGNTDYEKVLACTNRTLPVMPCYDTTVAYAMPWGNQKPICEILCEFEDIEWRFEATNALLKIADLLTQCQEEAAIKLSSNPEQSELASIVVEAIEEAAECFATFRKIVQASSDNYSITSLDILLKKARLISLNQLYEDFVMLKFELFNLNDLSEHAIQQLGVFAQRLNEVANDPELSIPDIVVHMIVDGEVAGHARIPAAEVYFGQSSIRCGKWCGRIRAVPLSWPLAQVSKFRGHELPGFVYLKMWFGKSRCRNSWVEQIKPGAMNYYAEYFYNEKRSTFSDSWKEAEKNPWTVSDETGTIELNESTIRAPYGWEFKGQWVQRRTHDMWIGEDAGHTTFEDEFFELEQRDQTTQVWMKSARTDYYGEPLDAKTLNAAPSGWIYETGWQKDLHCIGDSDGWVYSITNNFWEGDPSTLDSIERQTHRYRRRRWKRTRRFATNNVGVTEMFEDVRAFAKNLDEEGFEYAKDWGKPVHALQQSGDRFRRRRVVREMVPVKSSNYRLEMGVQPSKSNEPVDSTAIEIQTLSPRIYEAHAQVSVFQLRVHLLWARELHSPKRHISRAYVRVFFLNRCQQTCVVENSMNPIWNETLIFSKILIPGGNLSLRSNPPSAVVECHGEEINGRHVFLGRFDAVPSAINSLADVRAKPVWYPLRFSNNKTKGALLMCMELFQDDPTTRDIVPKLPAIKNTGRYEVSPDVRPKFGRFTVQLMAWGVRNLARFQLLSVRSPFIEITVADRRDITDTIRDTQMNPNFVRQLLTFSDVVMPKQLTYAPPIVLNLHDRRSFGREPLIGVAVIKNFQRYMHSLPPKSDLKQVEADWATFNTEVTDESKRQVSETMAMRLGEPEEYVAFPNDANSPNIDWWSKYYHSKGDKEKAPGYEDLGLDRLQVYNCPLENVGDYNGFADFLDTFTFFKPNSNSLDGDLSAEKKGELKGKLFITKHDNKRAAQNQFVPSGVEFDKPVVCLVRVYVVRAYDLTSMRRSGQCDPYLSLRFGNKKKCIKDKDYVPETHDPIFGKCIEMEVTIPQEKDLTITVMDRRLLFADNEIGSTTIDLENRLLTKHRATVGLPAQYNVIGPLIWRDQLNPLQTLQRYCSKMNVPPPRVLHSKDSSDVGLELVGVSFWMSEIEPKALKNENFSGRPINRVALHILRKIGLVPEHIESRPLFNSVNPANECGTLEMFVDVFPKLISDRIPPAIDITPREPVPLQLRIALFGLRNVILQKKSMGRPAADLYVRCYLNGMLKSERTDIHYRCLDGAASFNWRFVFDFGYDAFERQIRALKKKRLFRQQSSELVDPVLVIEIWDNNKFKRDRYIGQCLLNLLGFEEGQIDEEEMENVKYEKEPPLRTCCAACTRTACYCRKTRCCMKKQRKKDLVAFPRAPRYIPGKVGKLSLFQQRSTSGWFPALSSEVPKKQRDDKKKNDHVEKDDAKLGDAVQYVTGMLEMEISLLPLDDALADPVGTKRRKPNHSPYLEAPDRPKMDSFWCTSRLKAGSRICWNKCGGWSCIWMTLFVVLSILIVVAVIATTIWRLPDVLAKKYLP